MKTQRREEPKTIKTTKEIYSDDSSDKSSTNLANFFNGEIVDFDEWFISSMESFSPKNLLGKMDIFNVTQGIIKNQCDR